MNTPLRCRRASGRAPAAAPSAATGLAALAALLAGACGGASPAPAPVPADSVSGGPAEAAAAAAPAAAASPAAAADAECALLHLVNGAPEAALRADAVLDAPALAALLAWRAGPDAAPDTLDDGFARRKADLDALPWATPAVRAQLLAAAARAGAAACGPTEVQLLAFNDFHGNLEPPGGSGGRVRTGPDPDRDRVDAGGVAYLAAHIAALRAKNPHTAVVAAGDMVGATPLLSALFHDEPTVEALNALGLVLTSVGNHEFDEGWEEILRLQRGGCHPTDGCQDGDPFGGARYQYLAANVIRQDTGQPFLPAVAVRRFGGVRVGFIGLTLEGTPAVTVAKGIAGLQFRAVPETVNTWARALRERGVETIVVLLHEGGENAGLYNECPGLRGPLPDLVHQMDPAVDAVISGHTHQAYVCRIDGKLVTSAAAAGRIVTRLALTVDPRTQDVAASSAEQIIATRDVPPDPEETRIIEHYNAFAAPLAGRVLGRIEGDLTTRADAEGETAMGEVIADAQLAATRAPERGGAVLSFMNPGGVRADLVAGQITHGEKPGEVTYGEAFAVHPFGNLLVTVTLTGEGVHEALEAQWTDTRVRLLQVSEGFTYTYDMGKPVGQRVDPRSIRLRGQRLDPKATYRVTVNGFLAEGGDGFDVFRRGTDRLTGAVDIDALSDYLKTRSPLPVPKTDRVRGKGAAKAAGPAPAKDR